MTKRKPIPRKTFVELIKKRVGRVKCEICENCKDGIVNDLDQISHKDEDPNNNSDDNLQLLCKMCHNWYHYQMKVERRKENDVQNHRTCLEDVEAMATVPFAEREEVQQIWSKIKLTDEQLLSEKEYLKKQLNKEVKEQQVLRKSLEKEFLQYRRGENIPDRTC